jgi:glycosyltransferase involved in cell wall biosynthesis
MLVDVVPEEGTTRPEPELLSRHRIARRSIRFPTRRSSIARLLFRKAAAHVHAAAFSATGHVFDGVFGDRTIGMEPFLRGLRADAYIAHNIETLAPVMRAARGRADVVFDCMEFYSGMGEGQSPQQSQAASAVERLYLRECALVIASSDTLADALAQEYGIERPLPSYNVPPKVESLPPRRGGGLNLYWRNSTIGFGQRGLQDVLEAMQRLPPDVRLFLQGGSGFDGGRAVRARAASLGLGERVTVLPPHAPSEAVQSAAAFEVGLCLERRGPRNHELTVSNKLFDYHMGGLAIVSSDLPALRAVIERSRGGLLFEPGDPASLALAIERLRASPALLHELQTNARRFALAEANLELELPRLSASLDAALFRRAHGISPS